MNYLITIFLLLSSTVFAQKNLKFSDEVGYVDVTADGLIDIEEYAERKIDPWKESDLKMIREEQAITDQTVKGQEWKLIVPRDYNPNLPTGLLVVINPFQLGFVYDQHWKTTLARRNMILLYPSFSYDVYNKIPFEKRSMKPVLYEMTTLTGIKIVKKKYKIDDNRIYLVDRYSKLFFGPKYADIFKGIIHPWASRKWYMSKLKDNITEVPSFLVSRKNSLELYKNWKKMGIVFVTTDEKPEHNSLKEGIECYKKHNFPNLLEVDFHQRKSSNTYITNHQLDQALDFLERDNLKKAKLLSEKAKKLEETQTPGYVALYKQAALLGYDYAVSSFKLHLKWAKEKNEEMKKAFDNKHYPEAIELSKYVVSVWGDKAEDALKIQRFCKLNKKIALELKADAFLKKIILQFQEGKIDKDKYKAGLTKIITLCPETNTSKKATDLKSKIN